MTEKEKMQELEEKITQAIYEAEEFAKENNLGFSIEPAYGMGGYFDGAEGEWYPSSQSC